MLAVSRLILDGAPLPDVLAVVAQLVELHDDDARCSIWLPERDGKQIYCAAAPGIPSFRERVGPFLIDCEGGPLGAAIHKQAPLYVSDILNEKIWGGFVDLMTPFGISALWVWPFFSKDNQLLGAVAIHHREPHSQLLMI